MRPNTCRSPLTAFAVAFVMTAAFAETFTLAPGGSGEGAQAFWQTAAWYNASGASVSVAPAKGNDYVVDNGRSIWVNSTRTFGGDSLRIGQVGGTKGRFVQTGADNTATIGKLILANGHFTTWRGSNDTVAYIDGNTLVTSPASAPFWICPTHDGGNTRYVLQWSAAISGAVGTGLYVGKYPTANQLSSPTLRLTADNAQYLGVIEVVGTNTLVRISQGTSLGGALEAFEPSALVLRQGGELGVHVASVTLSRDLNRGIRIGEGGGVLRVDSGKALRVEWPISGSGTLEKRGAGQVTLASAWNQTGDDRAARLVVSEGCLELSEGFSCGGDASVTVNSGGYIGVAAGDVVELGGLVLEDGAGFRVSYDESTGKSGVLVLADGLDAARTYPILPCAAHSVKVPFLKVPIASGEITAANFRMSDDLAVYGLPTADVVVEQDGAHYVVSCKTYDYVYSISDANVYICRYDAQNWSDKKIPHAGADYDVCVTNANKLLGSTGMPDTYVFPGGYISLRGNYSKSHYAIWDLDGISFTADVRTGEMVEIKPSAKADDNVQYLRGKLHVGNATWNDYGLRFAPRKGNMTFVIESRITGSGVMALIGTPITYVLAGDNAFTGNIFVYGGTADNPFVLRFSRNANFGVNPPSMLEDGYLCQGHGELYPIGSVRIDLPNRQFKSYANTLGVRVDAGEVFELYSPMAFGKGTTVEKRGGGTWAVGGSTKVFGSSTALPTVNVADGYLRADNARAFTGVVVTMAEGAGIEAKYDPAATGEAASYGMIVTDAAKFSVVGETLKFRAVTGGAKVRGSTRIPFLTVPASVAAVIDAKTLELSHDIANREGSIVRDEVTLDKTSYVRYSGKFRQGSMLLVR